jgi:two-component system osmolarity sensor histidine kinase EnvZ
VALERVLTNLLKNAVQYGGSPIDIDLHCTHASVALEICDRGPGIPEGQEEAVFRPFHRLETSRSRQPGSGLGLAIARQIALRNDWKIELLPRKGGGTIARLSLPPARRDRWFRSSGRSGCASPATTTP